DDKFITTDYLQQCHPAAAIQQGKVESSKDFLIATLKPR
ncbi:TPA: hypothetical protein ACHVXE_005843, partial [Klebsiella pneumoniae]